MENLGKVILWIGVAGLLGAEMYGAFQLAKTIGECEGKADGIVVGVFMAGIHFVILGLIISNVRF